MTAIELLAAMPSKVNPEDLAGINTVFQFDFGTEGQKTLSIIDGKPEIVEGLVGEAECVLTSKGDDFVKLMNGDLNPMMAVMMGKIKLSNVGAMMKYAKIFGIM
jgi:putative sterol carrier protein